MISRDEVAGLVERARCGNSDALDDLVRAIQDQIHSLALRMLWHPEDARDATQEILIRIVTHLSDYRGESAFTTWCYAIAANHLRSIQRSRAEQAEYTFVSFETELLEPSGSSDTLTTADHALALEEVKIGCTLGMLLCLDREHRLAYILGEILELDHNEAAWIAAISPAAFRQRLARARNAIIAFTGKVCGVVDAKNPCRCKSRIGAALERGRIRPGEPLFGESSRVTAQHFGDVERHVRSLEGLQRAAALYRAHPSFAAPEELLGAIRAVLHAREASSTGSRGTE